MHLVEQKFCAQCSKDELKPLRKRQHPSAFLKHLPFTIRMSLQYTVIPVTPFQQNCSVLWCTHTREAVIVDPGGDLARIERCLAGEKLTPVRILLTHAHLDHVGGAAELAEHHDVPITGPHPEDRFWLDLLPDQCSLFGFPDCPPFLPDQWLHEGDSIRFGQETLAVRHCPGHTPGHVIFFHADSKLAVVGDVLFKGSIGRTDFPRGNHRQLLQSIREGLFTLGDDVLFIPGHGPLSTLGEERHHNPFVAE